MFKEIAIVGFSRTPIGALLGSLSSVTAPQLGAAAIRTAVERSDIDANGIDEVLMGHVLTAGCGQGPTRQAALSAGIAQSAVCSGVSKVCGSGMKAVMLAHDSLQLKHSRIAVAGGMESMSNAPYLLARARSGYRLGHDRVIDHLFYDGLEDAYFHQGELMGQFAEQCAEHFSFTREQQDEFAISSLQRAQQAIDGGAFQAEIAPVTFTMRSGQQTIQLDEIPGKANIDKIPRLKPAFKPEGSVTAANSSSISDGAAALLLMPVEAAETDGIAVQAIIRGHSSYAGEPCWFTTAPVFAIRLLLQQLDWSADDVDLWEINEAFAVVTMAAIELLELNPARVNIHGGACALGHPIGASGARIIVTLLAALQHHHLQRGIAALCIGGGEATAIAIEIE